MRYLIETYRVRLEVAESGLQMRDSGTAEIIARSIFNRLDADREHFVVLCAESEKQNRGSQRNKLRDNDIIFSDSWRSIHGRDPVASSSNHLRSQSSRR